MRSSFTLATALLSIGFVEAIPHAKVEEARAVVTAAPAIPKDLLKRQSPQWTTPPWCSTDTAVSTLQHPPEPFNATSFCYYFLQATSRSFVVTSASVDETETFATTTYTRATVTTTDQKSTTTTLFCPSASASMTCDYPASANSLNVLGTLYDLSAEECQQACLARKDCLSFGVVPNSNGLKKWTNCNLLKTYTKGNVFASSDSGLISDRDCQTNRPKGCASKQFARANAAPVAVRDAAPAMITLAPIAAGEVIKEEMAKQEKALEKRQKDPAEWPTWLQSLGIIPVFLGCSCVVTEAAPTVHETVTLVVPIYSTTSVTYTSKDTTTVSVRPHWSTAYTTVV